jgi:hypothetical protein
MTDTVDQRAELARQFLAEVRQRSVEELAPTLLMREVAELRRLLGQVLDVIDEADEADDGTEPYCTICGQWVGMFHGLDGWHHYLGDPAPGGHRELYDAAHEPVIAWTVPPGRAISPARMTVIRVALADADAYRTAGADARCEDCMVHPAGCCDRHADDLEQADAYRRVLRELGGQQ